MQITWADVNWVVRPGVYQLPDGRQVQISAIEIARWMENPEGVFGAYWYPGDRLRAARFTLTDFHPNAKAQQSVCRTVEVAA